MVADGLELIDMERIGNPGEQEFVSVWASGNGESRLSVPRNFANFITLGEQQTAAGMRTQDFEFFLSDAASDRKSTRLNSSHVRTSRMQSSA